MKTWNKKRLLSAILVICIVTGFLQNPVLRVKAAKTAANNELSVTARIGSDHINQKTISLKKGSSEKISLSVTPADSKVKMKYRSSRKNIVSVTKEGILKAKKQGTAKITITVTKKGTSPTKIWFMVKVTAANAPAKKKEIPVTLTVGDKKFTANFYDNKTAKELLEKMPMTLSMKELNGNEKYHYFDTDFSVNETSPKQIHAGDIMMYGSDCLVAFYKTFTTSYRYTSIGYVEDASGFAKAVGKGNVTITFQKG